MDLKVHHIGYAVPSIDTALEEFAALGWRKCGGTTDDCSRQVRIAFMERDGYRVELVAPLSAESPIHKMLQKGSGTPYHFCYEVDNMEMAESELKKMKFIPFRKASAAPAIGGRRVEFFFAKNVGVFELVESTKP